MPELPEVETTRRGLAPAIEGQRLERLSIYQNQLRWPILPDLADILRDQILLTCRRRGKYLLFYFESGVLLVHLGMSGSMRLSQVDELLRKHDHVVWDFGHITVRLNDPRRFGSVVWHPHSDGPILEHRLLKNLGIEPLSEDFTIDHLYQGLKSKKKPIKTALLDGDIVVGVGNIYASESLFLAKINPKISAQSLSKARAERLHSAILKTLNAALESGGSTLRDFLNASGEPGAYFDIHANVYNREKEPCHVCETPIRKIVQAQRATYYCVNCQRR
ncbi:MAG: bifunctional DNA-formamidopyrimidine glycosylase/DNA-(apurinic or apyrimidinic site) lyase [Alcaligenaceae bacterium]|nr:bifunctional DNA-formamidopyrimidine glycosylase/DNA-(apurinic or apyrimidinic site) lyase [Alcaligenaceae bacterium]